MDVMSRPASSALNPNAPLFVPLSYQAVEDYSVEWWALVQSSPWFRDYWLSECFQDPQNTPPILSEFDDPFLPENIDDLFDSNNITDQGDVVEKEEEGCVRDLVSLGYLNRRKSRVIAETTRNFEKVPKIVNFKLSPRPIQQPR